MQLSPSLSEKLYAAFPRLYRGRHKSMYESSMCWGFVYGEGWYRVLYDLSQELNDYLEKNPSIDFEVMQVKSKFGVLRFPDYRDLKTEQMISVACQRASATCEVSGKPI